MTIWLRESVTECIKISFDSGSGGPVVVGAVAPLYEGEAVKLKLAAEARLLEDDTTGVMLGEMAEGTRLRRRELLEGLRCA